MSHEESPVLGGQVHLETDQTLAKKIGALGSEAERLHDKPTVEEVEARVRQWIVSAQADFKALAPTSPLLETKLREIGVGVLLSVPAIAKEVEAALCEHLAAGLMTNGQREQRIAELNAERNLYSEERERRRRGKATHVARSSLLGATLSGASIKAINGNAASAKVEFRKDGTVFEEVNDALRPLSQTTDWLRPTYVAPGGWLIRAQLVSGDKPAGAPLDAWLSLVEPRSWALFQSGPGRKSAELAISLSNDGGATAGVVAPYHLAAEVPG